MIKKYIVNLTERERKKLEELLKHRMCSKEKRIRAYTLLKSSEGWSDKKIAESYGVTSSGIERIRKRFFEKGFKSAINRKKRIKPSHCKPIRGEEEARLIALCCSEPPSGRSRWSLRLLTKKIVELEIVESIGRESLRKALKKINLSLG